jgi:hypothetical protein
MPTFLVARDSQPEPAPEYAEAIIEGFKALGAEQSDPLCWYISEFDGTTDELLTRIQSFMDPAVGLAVLEVRVNS